MAKSKMNATGADNEPKGGHAIREFGGEVEISCAETFSQQGM